MMSELNFKLQDDVKQLQEQMTELEQKINRNIMGTRMQEKMTELEQKINRNMMGTRLLLTSANFDLGKMLIAAVEIGDTEQVLFLLEHRANVEYSKKNNNRPIHSAVICDEPRILEILIENGANINAQGENQKMALHFAASYNRLECAKVLIGKGANLECLDQWRNTPILHAASSGFDDIIKLLLQKGANVNAHEHIYKMTGLHCAANAGHLSTVKHLVSNGANTALKNVDGKTALDLAVEMNQELIVDFLGRQ